MIRAVGLATGMAVLGQAALADVYECGIRQFGSSLNWIAPVIAVTHEAGSDSASVSDGIILQLVGKPVAARVETENEKRTTFVWEVKARDDTQQGVRMLYRLTIMKADLRARVKAVPMGYANNFDADGQCKRVKG